MATQKFTVRSVAVSAIFDNIFFNCCNISTDNRMKQCNIFITFVFNIFQYRFKMCVTVFVISKHNSKFVDYQTCNRWLSTSEATRGSPTANSDCKITQVEDEMNTINIYHEMCVMFKNFCHF